MSAARGLLVEAGPGSLQEEEGGGGGEEAGWRGQVAADSPVAAARTRHVVAAGPGSLRRTAARARQVRGLSAKEEDTTPTNRKQGPIY